MWCVALASNNWFLSPAPGLTRPCATCGFPFPTVSSPCLARQKALYGVSRGPFFGVHHFDSVYVHLKTGGGRHLGVKDLSVFSSSHLGYPLWKTPPYGYRNSHRGVLHCLCDSINSPPFSSCFLTENRVALSELPNEAATGGQPGRADAPAAAHLTAAAARGGLSTCSWNSSSEAERATGAGPAIRPPARQGQPPAHQGQPPAHQGQPPGQAP